MFDFLDGFFKRGNPVARLRVLFDGFKPLLRGDEVGLLFGEFAATLEKLAGFLRGIAQYCFRRA